MDSVLYVNAAKILKKNRNHPFLQAAGKSFERGAGRIGPD